MPLTPEDVSNKRFTTIRLREGYDMGEVDQFLDEVEAELARLSKENDDLRSKVSTAQGTGSSTPATPTSGKPAADKTTADKTAAGKTTPAKPTTDKAAGEKAAGEKAAAEKDSEPAATPASGAAETIKVETVPQASNAAARLLEIATRNADELVEEAKNEADRIVGEARTKSERLESESKTKTDQLEADARKRSERLDGETADRRKELLGNLERERDQLNTDVEGLRSFEREYRSRLKSYFTQQLEALDTRASSQEPDGAAADGGSGEPKRLRSILGDDETS